VKSRYVADTMFLVLWLEKRKLPTKMKAMAYAIEKNQVSIIIPAMVLAEVGYLSEKKRIDLSLKELKSVLNKSESVKIQSINEEIIFSTFEITDIPELHDRIIAATARFLKLPLLTNDPIIFKSKFVDAIW
jgi:predicted nucleic acid-binding protein